MMQIISALYWNTIVFLINVNLNEPNFTSVNPF